MDNKYLFCRICGFKQDDFPWGEDNKTPSFDICPCCGVEFGYEDSSIESIKKYREEWLRNEAKWFNQKGKPAKWDINNQMKNIPEEFK